MLENGRADAFMMDDVLLAGEKAKAKILMNGSSSARRNRLRFMVA